MSDDLAPLLDRIRLLADQQPSGSPQRLLEQMEHTLTDGYARALALEGDGLRIEKEIGAAARNRGTADPTRVDLLVARLAATERELRSLRAHLASLHRRTEAVRASAVASR